MTRRWLNSADVEIDDATGAILVDVGEAGTLAGPYRTSSGGAPIATTGPDAVTMITVGAGHTVYHCRYVNGTVAGMISLDSGTTWEYLPANTSGILDGIKLTEGEQIQIKRIGAADMNGVSIAVWGV